MKPTPCPCGGKDYAVCCGRYHGGTLAPDAEALMRSRYSAYVLKLEAYLLDTWHPDTRPALLDLADDNAKWLGLEVKKHIPESAERATVEFVARYKIGGRAHRLHETSRFVREDGRWLYLDGEFDA
ncbi:MAG TPA: YchJ family metal-binding protein [Gallionella sp.]|nr:YchJ family metal-binding protein [Gallionella sp.]